MRFNPELVGLAGLRALGGLGADPFVPRLVAGRAANDGRYETTGILFLIKSQSTLISCFKFG